MRKAGLNIPAVTFEAPSRTSQTTTQSSAPSRASLDTENMSTSSSTSSKDENNSHNGNRTSPRKAASMEHGDDKHQRMPRIDGSEKRGSGSPKGHGGHGDEHMPHLVNLPKHHSLARIDYETGSIVDLSKQQKKKKKKTMSIVDAPSPSSSVDSLPHTEAPKPPMGKRNSTGNPFDPATRKAGLSVEQVYRPRSAANHESDMDFLEMPLKNLFESYSSEKDGLVAKSGFLKFLWAAGLRESDPRLAVSMRKFAAAPARLNLDEFRECVRPNFDLISRAIRGDFIIPDFPLFCKDVKEIFEQTRGVNEGNVATYIPQLARVDPSYYAVSVCTVNGQRYDLGDSNIDFCIQSCCKPINYCLALEEHGADWVHNYVGREPSGRHFNDLVLNERGLPHNPMINAGAIMTCAMLKPKLALADKFDYVIKQCTKLAGGAKVGFSNSTYLSEKDTADRNYALGYYMREKNGFPPGTKLLEVLEFYFQCCSIEMTSEAMSVIAGTLANGGVCPVTDERVLDPATVRDCLSLMYSCGMYDYSGEFAFSIGLPAKSGVAGAIMIVIPNVMGICTYSPKLDTHGNSVRGIEFCKELTKRFNFHNFDLVYTGDSRRDPTKRKDQGKLASMIELMFATQSADLSAVRRQWVAGADINGADYDGRTPLHVAASEGHLNIIRYLIKLGAYVNPVDRWGATPLDDAMRAGKQDVVAALRGLGAETGRTVMDKAGKVSEGRR